MKRYSQKYQCRICERFYHDSYHCVRHERVCTGKTKQQYPGGFHNQHKTIFDRLEEFGIVVPQSKRLFDWFIVYDFEALLIPLEKVNEKNYNGTMNTSQSPLVFAQTLKHTPNRSVLSILIQMHWLRQWWKT